MSQKDFRAISDKEDLLQRKIANLYDKQRSGSTIRSELNTADKLSSFRNTIEELENDNSTQPKPQVSQSHLKKVSDMMENLDSTTLSSDIEPRKRLYNTYRFIIDNFPQISNATKIIVNHILNPEQLKNTHLVINSSSKRNSEKQNSERIEQKMILEALQIDKKTRSIVTNSLRDGDYFAEIINIDEYKFIDTEASKMLSESTDDTKLSEEVVNSYQYFEKTNKTELDAELNSLSVISEFANNFTSNSDATGFLSEVKELTTVNTLDFETEVLVESLKFDAKKVTTNKSNDDTEIREKYGKIITRYYSGEQVVKLSVGEICFGYLVIVDESALSGDSSENLFTRYNKGQKAQNKVSSKSIENAFKKQVIPKILGQIKPSSEKKSLITKLINNDERLKMIMFTLLGNGRKTNIRYVPETHMVHFKNYGLDHEEKYGQGILANQLFMIKHYFAVLMSHTKFSLTKSVEKELLYVNVNVDADVESSVNEVVRRMKKKEDVLNRDLASTDSFNVETSMFDRIYIPKVNGETPIEFGSVPTSQTTLDPQHLETLRQNIIRGFPVPRNLIGENDNTYKTSFTQENLSFAMSILGYQNMYAEQFSEFTNKIKLIVDSNSFQYTTVGFDSPQTLLNEARDLKIGSVREAVDFLTTLYSDPNNPQSASSIDRVGFAKILYPDFDWDQFDSIFHSSEQEKDIKNKTNPETQNSGGFY